MTVERVVEAPTGSVEPLMTDVEPFMRTAGFDEVGLDGDVLFIRNSVGLMTVELELELVEGGVLAYEQREGIFESMRTVYEAESHPDGTLVTADTTFSVDVTLVGELLDATVIKRQRRRELNSQFDYLERAVRT